MVQLTKQNLPQYAYLKLDGYNGTTSYYLTLENVLSGYKKQFNTQDVQFTNGRYTKCLVPMQSWHDDVDLHEGLYILEVKDQNANLFAKRLAFLRDNPAFKESTYIGYDGTDAEPYNVYAQ